MRASARKFLIYFDMLQRAGELLFSIIPDILPPVYCNNYLIALYTDTYRCFQCLRLLYYFITHLLARIKKFYRACA